MMIPQREEFAAVWRYLANRDGEVVEVPASLARKVAQEGDLWESTLHTMICLEVLESFDLSPSVPRRGAPFGFACRSDEERARWPCTRPPLFKSSRPLPGEKREEVI